MRQHLEARPKLVLCLYCETELNPFRGLFDEDFCCRDHREKYCSQFRRALTDFGSLAKADSPRAGSPARQDAVRPAAARDPQAAEFLPMPLVKPWAGTPANHWQPEAIAVLEPVEILAPEVAWSAVLEFEERPADVTLPADRAVSGLEPAPSSLEVPACNPMAEFGSAAPSLEIAGPATGHGTASGFQTPWTYAEPVALAPGQGSLPAFRVSTQAAVLEGTEEFAESTIFGQPLASAPMAAAEIALSHETSIPAFTPLCDSMQADEKQKPIGDPYLPDWGELYRKPTTGGAGIGSTLAIASQIVPVMALNSASHDRPVLVPSSQLTPHSFEIAPARSVSVPALPAAVPPPAVVPGLATAIVDSDAADSAAEPRSHEPMRLTFANLVRIKNWRLRLTFAKPA